MNPNGIIATLLTLMTVALLFTIQKTREYYINKKVFDHIAECFKDKHLPRSFSYYPHAKTEAFYQLRARDFLYYRLGCAEKEYEIKKEEEDIAIEIIMNFQRWLLELFFLSQLNTREFAKLESRHFLMKLFGQFLLENSGQNEFNKQKMFREKKEYSDTIYYFTDYSRVYYKMMYISLRYCDTISQTRDNNTARIKNILTTTTFKNKNLYH